MAKADERYRTTFMTHVARAALIIMTTGAVSCANRGLALENGAVLLDVRLPANAHGIDELRAWVYDDHGVIFKSSRLPASGPLPVSDGPNMGTVLIQPGVTTGDLRIHLRALSSQKRVLDGIVVVTPAMRGSFSVEIHMLVPIPADIDLDDVPDVIDDCLPGYNPDQGGCVDGGSGGRQVDGGSSGDARSGSGGAMVGMGGAMGIGGAGGATNVGGAGGATSVGGSSGGGGAAGGTGGQGGIGGSSGCGRAVSGAEGAVTLNEVESGTTVSRRYWLSVPNGYDPQHLHKLILALGAPASAVDAIRQQVGLQVAGATGAADEVFVYPFARLRNFGSWGTVAAWELGPGAAQTPAAGLDDVRFIDDVLNDVTARTCIDRGRIFVVGYGWGADFTNALACIRGDRLRAVVGAANNGTVALVNPKVSCVGQNANWTMQGKGDSHLGLAAGHVTLNYWVQQHHCSTGTQPLSVIGPNGAEDCVSYLGCDAPTRWCAYDAMIGSSPPDYLGREALGFFRGF